MSVFPCPKRLVTPGVVVAILMLATLAALRAPAADTFRLEGVKVAGSNRYQESEIARAAGLKICGSVTLEGLNEAAGKLASIGVFSKVNYSYTTQGYTLTVVFKVEDAPKLLPCSFENFVWFTPDELQQDLRARVPLYQGYAPPGGKMLEAISAELAALLESRGIHAQVQFGSAAAMGGPVQGMQLRVVGVPIPVRRVEFTGIQKIDPALLQKAALPLIDKDYDGSFIRNFSRRALVGVYHQQGYLRAEFGEPTVRLLAGDPTPNAVVVSTSVSEGEQYSLKEVAWSGESAILYTDLAKSLHVAIGSPANIVQLEQDVLALLLLFHPKGYLQANAKPNAVLDDASRSAVYQIEIRQGDLFRLGKLEIAGLDDTLAAAIEKRSQLRPGDPYDSTYWNRFLQDVVRQLPKNESGWKFQAQPTIRSDTKTVDVRLTFSPRLSRS